MSYPDPEWPAPGPHEPNPKRMAFSDVVRHGFLLDPIAVLLLLIALFLPWNRFYSLSSNHAVLVTVALVVVTVVSLGSLLLPYAAMQGMFGSGWTPASTRRVRLFANLPYLLFVLGFLCYDVIRGLFRFASSADAYGFVPSGVGTAAWFGVAGALLAAQPRGPEVPEDRSKWLGLGLTLLRVGFGLAIASLIANVVAAIVSLSASPGTAVKVAVTVLVAGLVAAAFVGFGARGMRRDFVAWRMAAGAVATTAMLAGLFLSFGAHTGDVSSDVKLSSATTSGGSNAPAAVIAKQPPVLVVLDTSSSMDDSAADGTARIAAARNAVDQLISSLDANREFGLVVYPGNGPEVNGCSAGELAIPLGTLSASAAHATVAGLVSDGDTPTGPALTRAAQLLRQSGDTNGIIVLVSDGESNCGPPPCEVARQLAREGIEIQVNTVGFQISDAGQNELECIAGTTGGRYAPVEDSAELRDAIEDLSAAGPQLSVPWLEYVHGNLGDLHHIGYFALLFWVAAAMAMLNPGGPRPRDTFAAGYSWLNAARHLMVLIAIFSYGSAAVDVLLAATQLGAVSTGASVVGAVFGVLTGVAATFAARLLRVRAVPDPRPAREPVLAACAAVALLAMVGLIVRAVMANVPVVGVLDLVCIWLPMVVAAALIAGRPVRELYAGARLFGGIGRPERPFGGPPFGGPPPQPMPPQPMAPPRTHGADLEQQAVDDPSTPASQLDRIARTRPELRAAVARHPNAHAGLLAWLSMLHDPAVDDAIARREQR